MDSTARDRQRRALLEAERHTPELLQDFLADLEGARGTGQVWRLLVDLGQTLALPAIDLIVASAFHDDRETLFIRTSYESGWLQRANSDPEVAQWSYFRNHAMRFLTPVAVGLEFIDEYRHLPQTRVKVLEQAAEMGIRAGFAIPLRLNAPPQRAIITFAGDHSRREMLAIINAHGWTLNVAAMAAFQRYMGHFARECVERNHISPKQRALLGKIGQGLQDKQIAADLGISVSAVRQRMQHLMAKTGLGNRAGLAALAMSMGLVPELYCVRPQERDAIPVEIGL